jgi:hypothetical protein
LLNSYTFIQYNTLNQLLKNLLNIFRNDLIEFYNYIIIMTFGALESAALLGASGAVLAGGGSLVSHGKYIRPRPNKPVYDFWNSYCDISAEFVTKIDNMLVVNIKNHVRNGARIEHRLLLPGNMEVPNVGIHRWFDKEHNKTISLAKQNNAKEGDYPKYYYTLFYTDMWIRSKKASANNFINILFTAETNTVNVIRFENTEQIYKPQTVQAICNEAKPFQQKAINIILKKYNEQNNKNVKTIISGDSGVGKSYTAMLLKKALEESNTNTNVLLFENFDPSAPGLEINKMVLRYASEHTPIILIINEIDTMYDEVWRAKDTYDPQVAHTKNKISFNNMLDNIASTKYVIALYTSEKSPKTIQDNRENYPFYRPGRVDFFIKMTETNSVLVNHNNNECMPETNSVPVNHNNNECMPNPEYNSCTIDHPPPDTVQINIS